MAKFRFSAFSDEYSPMIDEQIKGLIENDIHMMEIRGVDGTGIADITEEKAIEVKAKLDKAGISVSAIGSPIGKIGINDNFEKHKKLLHHVCKLAQIFETDRIRIFSFYIPEGEAPEKYKDVVLSRMCEMLDIADEYGLKLCHENEKGIYGDIPERCLEIVEHFDGRLGCIFDPCNFLQCGAVSFPAGFALLKEKITYMHIKDCKPSGTIVVSGAGSGGIPEIFAYLNRTRDDIIVLTIEPHLKTFSGLSGLEKEGERTQIHEAYETSAEAFAAAISAARSSLPRNAVVIK